MLLAATLILQGLRLILPMPPQASMILIGSLVNACFLLAVLLIGLKPAVLLALVTPVAAYFQGMLPFLPFVGPVALGNSLFVIVFYMQRRHAVRALVAAALAKTAALYGGFCFLFSLVAFPEKITHMILFIMSWPQIVTAVLGGILAFVIAKRLAVISQR